MERKWPRACEGKEATTSRPIYPRRRRGGEERVKANKAEGERVDYTFDVPMQRDVSSRV